MVMDYTSEFIMHEVKLFEFFIVIVWRLFELLHFDFYVIVLCIDIQELSSIM